MSKKKKIGRYYKNTGIIRFLQLRPTDDWITSRIGGIMTTANIINAKGNLLLYYYDITFFPRV